MQASVNYLLYKDYPSVSVFPFIPREADVEFVLLRDTITGKISEVSGRSSEVDACILFTAARSLLRETSGLFTSTNLLSDGTKELEVLAVSKPELYNCNLILNEPEFDKLLKQFVRTGEHVNVDSEAKVIALPIAPIDLKAFNAYLKKIEHPKEVVIISASSLTQKQDLDLEPATQEHLNAVMANLFTTIPFVINESKRKHYAVITCFDPATSSRMYDHCEYLVQGAFRRQDESWHYFKAAMGELPDAALLEKLEAIIVPGAAGSCYDTTLTWIPKLEELIRHVYKNTKIRYLGLCYGAQVMSQALGGKVERNTRVGFKAATESITLNDDFYEAPYVKAHTALYTKKPKTLCIVKSHGDYISKLPEDATLFASSETSKHELFCVGDRFLGTQGHPEYTSDFVCSRDGKVALSKATEVEISEYEEKKRLRKEKNYSQPEDRFDLRSIFMNFLRRNYE